MHPLIDNASKDPIFLSFDIIMKQTPQITPVALTGGNLHFSPIHYVQNYL